MMFQLEEKRGTYSLQTDADVSSRQHIIFQQCLLLSQCIASYLQTLSTFVQLVEADLLPYFLSLDSQVRQKFYLHVVVARVYMQTQYVFREPNSIRLFQVLMQQKGHDNNVIVTTLFIFIIIATTVLPTRMQWTGRKCQQTWLGFIF